MKNICDKENRSVKVLLVSPFYPSADSPAFGVFVKNLHDEITAGGEVQFAYCVRTRPGRGHLTKMISYLWWSCRTLFLGIQSKYDLIHVHTVYPAGFLAQLIKLIRKKPVLVTIHGGDIHGITHNRFLRSLIQWTLRNADCIQAVSPYIQSRVRQLNSKLATKVVVQCMGVDTNKFFPSPTLPKNDRGPRLVFSANMVEGKGWKVAFDAVRILNLRGIRCAMDVFGAGEQLTEAKLWAEQNKMSEQIILHGGVEQEVVAKYLRNADLFLLPSQFNEGFSLASAEALASGVPIVVSGKGALPDLAKESSCSFVVNNERDSNDVANSCASAIECLNSSDVKNKKSLLKTRHSLKYAAQHIQRIYYDLL